MRVPKVPTQLFVPIETKAGDYDEKHVLTVSRLSGFCFGLLQPARHAHLAVIVIAAVKYRWTYGRRRGDRMECRQWPPSSCRPG
jgi:hypothetical protein